MRGKNKLESRSAGTSLKTVSPCVMFMIMALVLVLLETSCRALFVPISSSFQVGFYNQSCPTAESIVRSAIQDRFRRDVTIPARIIRLMFHECFVTGCDASLLIDSTAISQAEKDAGPNLNVKGYDLVDAAKTALEAACPGVVSCADIQVLLAREAVGLLGGPFFNVPTGRLDSRNASLAGSAFSGLPGLSTPMSQMISIFAAKGFSVLDMVTLLGAHSVGAAFCNNFSYRLYNFGNTTGPDPRMDNATVTNLRLICPQTPINPDPTVALDQGNNSINVMDSGFYQQLLNGHGVLEVDQALTFDNRTAPLVSAYAANGTVGNATVGNSTSMNFFANFAQVMVKLSTLDVLSGNSTFGSIRTNCSLLS